MARLATIGWTGLVVGFGLACTGGEAPEEERAADPAPAASAAPAPAAATPSWKLTGVQAGDASCYLEGTGPDGAAQTLQADFELCPGGSHDATGLVGREVTVATRPSEVQAPSCAGDPECPDHVTVDLVVGLTPVGGAAGAAESAAAETCPVDALEKALADSDVAAAVSSGKLRGPKCTLIWATAATVPAGDGDSATVLFSRSAKGTWVAVNAGTGGVCDEVPEEERASLDCG